ncbi:MAG TPA: hypothetical protein VF541_17740 [Longimicrobium sp.]|jgi:hypothetical protein
MIIGSPRRYVVVAAFFAASACEGGSGGALRTPTPATLVATSSTTQSAVVGEPVPLAPSVRVLDDRGRPMAGVGVAFAVTAGGGSVTASATSDAAGVAVAADWTMGTVPQDNLLTASVPGVAPVVFRAAALAGRAVAMEKASVDNPSGVVASTLADSVGVRVTDRLGNGVPGEVVTFTGFGTSGLVTTGTQGYARVSVRLPLRARTYTLTATAGTLPQQVFKVTALPGPPAGVMVGAGDKQTWTTGRAVPVPPAVRVFDQYQNEVPGIPVIFAPEPGSGTVTGATAVTNEFGFAAVGSWTLGNPGANRLDAVVDGRLPFAFTANSLPPCGSRTYEPLSILDDVLVAERCRVGGYNTEVFTVPFGSAQGVEFAVSSSQFDPVLKLLDGRDQPLLVLATGGAPSARLRLFAPAGAYRIGIGPSFFSGEEGAYRLSSTRTADADGCIPFSVIVPDITVTGEIHPVQCNVPVSDRYILFLGAGQRLELTMSTSVLTPRLELRDNFTVVASSLAPAAGADARIVFTAPHEGLYELFAISETQASGAYTLKVLQR